MRTDGLTRWYRETKDYYGGKKTIKTDRIRKKKYFTI